MQRIAPARLFVIVSALGGARGQSVSHPLNASGQHAVAWGRMHWAWGRWSHSCGAGIHAPIHRLWLAAGARFLPVSCLLARYRALVCNAW